MKSFALDLHKTNTFSERYSLFTTGSLAVIITVCVFVYAPSIPMSWDVFGYYLYLPATFLYHDLGLNNVSIVENIIDTYKTTATFYQASKTPEGIWVMKYSMGMAVLYSPFFFLGHVVALIAGAAPDGFSKPYQISMIAGSLLYSLVGLFVLRKVLLKFFSDKISSMVLILIVLGTNYFHNVVFSALMPHNYLFTIYALILWYTIRWHETYQMKHILLCALFCGLCILSRPSEIVCLFIPVLWSVNNKESFAVKLQLLWKNRLQVMAFLAVIILIGIPQLIYWKITVGKFIYNSYNNPGEGFEFLDPYIGKVLFSFRKGWFVYTPLMIFAMIGIYKMYLSKWSNSIAILTFTILTIYVVSSWSCWWYADSFSQRALMQSYAVFSLPLGYFISTLESKKRLVKSIIGSLFFLFIVLNLFQTWQINNGILHSSRTTFAYYKAVSGKTKVTEEDQKLLSVYRPYDGKEILLSQESYSKSVIGYLDFEEDTMNASKDFAHSGKFSLKMDSTFVYSPGIERKYLTLTDKDHAWIRATVMVYPIIDLKQNPASLVISFEHNGYSYKYYTMDFENLGHLELNKWNKVTFEYLTPEVRKLTDNLKVYVWHRGKQNIYIDDFKIEVLEPKNN